MVQQCHLGVLPGRRRASCAPPQVPVPVRALRAAQRLRLIGEDDHRPRAIQMITHEQSALGRGPLLVAHDRRQPWRQRAGVEGDLGVAGCLERPGDVGRGSLDLVVLSDASRCAVISHTGSLDRPHTAETGAASNMA